MGEPVSHKVAELKKLLYACIHSAYPAVAGFSSDQPAFGDIEVVISYRPDDFLRMAEANGRHKNFLTAVWAEIRNSEDWFQRIHQIKDEIQATDTQIWIGLRVRPKELAAAQLIQLTSNDRRFLKSLGIEAF